MFRLFYPLRYFRLENPEKRWLDLWPTLVIAALLAPPFILVPEASFFRPNGFMDKILTLTSCLTGFYVAALVAAATFSHPDLDKVIQSGPIALVTKDQDGTRIQELLTRREFACTIFGYLSFACLLISIGAAFAISMSSSKLATLMGHTGFFWFRTFWVISYALLIAHLCVATSLGLYYLMDRLYRRDKQIVTPKPTSGSKAA